MVQHEMLDVCWLNGPGVHQAPKIGVSGATDSVRLHDPSREATRNYGAWCSQTLNRQQTSRVSACTITSRMVHLMVVMVHLMAPGVERAKSAARRSSGRRRAGRGRSTAPTAGCGSSASARGACERHGARSARRRGRSRSSWRTRGSARPAARRWPASRPRRSTAVPSASTRRAARAVSVRARDHGWPGPSSRAG